jgi:kumamolisin
MDYRSAHLFRAEVVDPETGLTPSSLPISGLLTPPQIAIAYSVPPATGYGVNIGIFSFGGGFLQTDLNKSFADLQLAGLIDSSITVPVIKTVLLDGQTGIFTNTGADGENTVDIFCIACMAPRASITIYIGNHISSMVTHAIADGMHIISMSWGTEEYTSDEVYFQQLADAKITFLASSGDNGSVVQHPDGTFTSTVKVVYPASSINAISAGGTKLTLTNTNNRLTETDDNRDPTWGNTWGGGGGISLLFSLPVWQNSLHYTPIINNVIGVPTPLTMRGTPDFSAPMNAYVFYQNGSIAGAGGTSLACPTLAGILARNLQLTGVRRTSADWNTIAYANPNAFFDITVGTNNDVITTGYAGTSGWDAVTGLGPPIGTSLYKLVNTGETFPSSNYGFRPSRTTGGQAYPRTTSAFPPGKRPS